MVVLLLLAAEMAGYALADLIAPRTAWPVVTVVSLGLILGLAIATNRSADRRNEKRRRRTPK